MMTWAGFLWLLCAIAAVWIALSFLPSSATWHGVLPELIALIVPLCWAFAPVMAVVACIGAAIGRQSWPMAIAQVCAVLFLAAVGIIRQGGSLRRTAPAAASTGRFRMMTLNCRYGRADAASIVRLVADDRVDVLALQEVSPELLKRLKGGGLGGHLPYSAIGMPSTRDNGGVNALFCREKPLGTSASSVDLHASSVPTATLRLDGRIVLFASAHTYSPRRGTIDWGQGIASLGLVPRFAREHGAEACLVAGDLNSNASHPTFRRLLDGHEGRLIDSSAETRSRLRRGPVSFPSNWPVVPPLLELDHILHAPGVRCTQLHAVTVKDSDHRALIGEFAIASR